jgi:hypothetical protein
VHGNAAPDDIDFVRSSVVSNSISLAKRFRDLKYFFEMHPGGSLGLLSVSGWGNRGDRGDGRERNAPLDDQFVLNATREEVASRKRVTD